MSTRPIRQSLISLFLAVAAVLPVFAQDLKLTEDMLTRYLTVYETVLASSPETAYRLFQNETLDPATPERAMADAALRQAGFESQQEFSAADVIIGTAWLQLTAEEMAESADRTKRDAVTAIEDALADPSIKDAQRAELEKALEQMQNDGQSVATASDSELIDQADMKLIRSYRERLQPVMTMKSADQLRGF